jgi:aconitate hydratase
MADKHFGARDTLRLPDGTEATIYRLSALEEAGLCKLDALPYTIRVLLEAAVRNHDGFVVRDQDVLNLAGWTPQPKNVEVPFLPARVVLQDFTGVPCVVDMAALRNAMVELGGDPAKVNPLVPVDLVIDHSVQVDVSGRFADAADRNVALEYERNLERYQFLKWGQGNLRSFRAVPPGRGIVHQINLEWIADCAAHRGDTWFPDSCVGTDSHTTMINGLGVLGWGVGGIEAEAVMLGQPIYMVLPEVIGFRLTGRLKPGVTATDMTLRIVQMLRKRGVVDKLVEFFGEGVGALSLADRATIANMAPEYGATCGFFPVDERTLEYLRLSGRDEAHVKNVEAYWRAQGMFWTPESPEPTCTDVLHLDLSEVQPALAGPKRPQDRVNLAEMKPHFHTSLTLPLGNAGHGVGADQLGASAPVAGKGWSLKHGDVVIAAITSCTNTSNPSVMLGAGLLARNAAARGLAARPWVKTSLAPGSRVVTSYYEAAGLLDDLAKVGFHTVGYGCTTCIGNSGPLEPEIEAAITEGKLVAGAVLSGNRNFEGRVHPLVKAAYLASPPLVVAYAIAGTLDIDFESEPIGHDTAGAPVFLREIWPSQAELDAVIASSIQPEMFRARYADVTAEPRWDAIEVADGALFPWDTSSTYIRQPSFFQGMSATPAPVKAIAGARVLLKLGDSITTDHISPAGNIAKNSAAATYLRAHGVEAKDFNSYGSRRGNHEVMVRGTFANVRIRNQVAPGTEGGVTTHFPTGEVTTVYDASVRYIAAGTPLIVLAGEQYGTGSSRDWAAKGTYLLGVRAVIAKSFERIHRSNLVGMGVLPMTFKPGEGADELGLDGTEVFDIPGIHDNLVPGQDLEVVATRADGTVRRFTAIARLDTPVEVHYFRNGGILHAVLRQLARG